MTCRLDLAVLGSMSEPMKFCHVHSRYLRVASPRLGQRFTPDIGTRVNKLEFIPFFFISLLHSFFCPNFGVRAERMLTIGIFLCEYTQRSKRADFRYHLKYSGQ